MSSSSSQRKILIIRFSSFGDIFHCMTCVEHLKDENTTIHWLTRSDFTEAVMANPRIDKVFSYHRDSGLKGLLGLTNELKKQNYTHIYDAHNNQRSHFVSSRLAPVSKRIFSKIKFSRRPKFRLKRMLWIYFKINFFAKPLMAAPTYLKPIKDWLVTDKEVNLIIDETAIPFDDYICLAPSAAWELKRWPVEHWIDLVESLTHQNFVVLGGPGDEFCSKIERAAPDRVKNLSGKLSWTQSMAMASNSKLVIGNDTGITHFADYIGHKTICIMGAALFCFPHRLTTKAFSANLECQPCTKDGRGKCKNQQPLKCLFDITPKKVEQAAKLLLKNP